MPRPSAHRTPHLEYAVGLRAYTINETSPKAFCQERGIPLSLYYGIRKRPSYPEYWAGVAESARLEAQRCAALRAPVDPLLK